MAAIYLGQLLPVGSCDLPAGCPPAFLRKQEGEYPGPSYQLLGLAGGGVCPAGAVTGAAVRSYRTISPLPVPPMADIGCVFSVALSLRLPRVAVSHHRCPVLLGLSSPAVLLRKSEAAGVTARHTLLIDYLLFMLPTKLL